MAEHPTYLVKIKEAEPEQFIFVTVRDGYLIDRTSSAMTEPVLREFFRVNGRPGLTEAEIDSCIETARTREA